MMTVFAEGKNRRIAAALHYFHVASRLLATGHSPWEFMGEAILNLDKTLKVLFSNSTDSGQDVRRALKALGYSPEETESFVAVMGLRDSLDSGHIMLSHIEPPQAEALYLFLSGREARFRELLTRTMTAVLAGTFAVDQEADVTLDSQKRRLFEEIRKANEHESTHPLPPG